MKPKYITVHCSATPPKMDVTASMIRDWHKARGWSDIGYHYVIRLDGSLEIGRPFRKTGAHVKGHNKDNIGICLIGGLDADGNPRDTFNDAQYATLRFFIANLAGSEGIKQKNIKGHRDWPNVSKSCPCFDVQDKLKEWSK